MMLRTKPLALSALFGLALAVAAPMTDAVQAQDVSGPFGGFRQDTSQPIEVAADELQVKQQEQMAVFIGSVDARQGDLRLQAQRVEVYYAQGGGGAQGAIRRLRAEGDVFITNGVESAQGDWADYNVETASVTMGDDVVMTQNDNVLRGARVEVDLNTGTAQLRGGNGRVQVLFITAE